MNDTIDTVFAKTAGAHIDLANAQAKTVDHGLVAVAISHAATRYNVFVNATQVQSGAQLKAEREIRLDQLTKEFRDFLEHHYDQYVENFDTLMSTPETSPKG